MKTILEIKNLNIKIKNKISILKDINLEIKESQTLALVGQSGSGKSMLAHSILNLLPRGANFSLEGEISFKNKNILNYSKKDLQHLRYTLVYNTLI